MRNGVGRIPGSTRDAVEALTYGRSKELYRASMRRLAEEVLQDLPDKQAASGAQALVDALASYSVGGGAGETLRRQAEALLDAAPSVESPATYRTVCMLNALRTLVEIHIAPRFFAHIEEEDEDLEPDFISCVTLLEMAACGRDFRDAAPGDSDIFWDRYEATFRPCVDAAGLSMDAFDPLG